MEHFSGVYEAMTLTKTRDWVVMTSMGKHFMDYATLVESAVIDTELYAPRIAALKINRHTKSRQIVYSYAYPGYFFAKGDVDSFLNHPNVPAKPLVTAGVRMAVGQSEIDRMQDQEKAWLCEADTGHREVKRTLLVVGDRVEISMGLLEGLGGLVVALRNEWVTLVPTGSNVQMTMHIRLCTKVS